MNQNQHRVRSTHVAPPVSLSASTRAAVLLCIAAMSGCAFNACPPIRAAWYVDDAPAASGSASAASAASAASPASAPSPRILLALLNEGTKASHLERVVVNPTDAQSGAEVLPKLAQFMPGQLWLFDVSEKLGLCRLPVAVQLKCRDGGNQTLAVSGLLPNYLHSTWIESCDVNKLTQGLNE